MPAPPPPPPPGLPSVINQSGGDDGRSMLLQSIRNGKALKKTVTVDRSVPLNAGKVCGAGSQGSRDNSNSRGGSSTTNSKLSSSGAGSNGLSGLFSDGMPKLRPTGRTLGEGTTGPVRPQPAAIAQRSDSGSRRPFGSEVRNRGPPPQPPPANQKPTISTSASDSVLTGGSRTDGLNVSGSHNHLAGSASPPSLPSKPPVINHGKPNLAPKPPGMASTSRPSPPPKKLSLNGSSRTSVTRAQSMRVPRSPPVAPPVGPAFPAGKELGKSPMAFHQSQDSLHFRTNPPPPPRTSTLPSNLNHHGGLKAVAPAPPPIAPQASSSRPLRPPASRPPPPPWRAGGAPMNPPLCPPPPPPPSVAPPPPPHHRTVQAPPPPPPPVQQTRLAPAVPLTAPPLPPLRFSSVRNGPAQSAAAEFDGRFGELFHTVDEFPFPQRYQNVKKVYNSKHARQPSSQQAKQQAPQPPTVQLTGRGWSGDVSSC